MSDHRANRNIHPPTPSQPGSPPYSANTRRFQARRRAPVRGRATPSAAAAAAAVVAPDSGSNNSDYIYTLRNIMPIIERQMNRERQELLGSNSTTNLNDDDDGREGQGVNSIDIEPPILPGDMMMFDNIEDGLDIESDDQQDVFEGDDNLVGFDDWFLRTFRDNYLHRLLATNSRLPYARAGMQHHRSLNTSSSAAIRNNSSSSVVLRQRWNREPLSRKPYIYQQPLPNHRFVFSDAEAYQYGYQHTLPGTGYASASLYCINSDIYPLQISCSNADDTGHSTVDNVLLQNSSTFQTTRAQNVTLELQLDPHERHCCVERIHVQAPKTGPPCVELMVFAANQRCRLDKLKEYDDYTFAKYEQMVKRNQGSNGLPTPIAYFWLAEEEFYKQAQVLPNPVTCRYLYVKMLRGSSSLRDRMALRLIRIYGWAGSRSFAETALC